MFNVGEKLFDAWTEDVGNTLKVSAKTVWHTGLGLTMVIAAVSMIVGIPLLEDAESFWAFFLWLSLTVYIVLLIMTVTRLLAASVYAKGEIVHQLQKQTEKMTVQEHGAAVVEREEKPRINPADQNQRLGKQFNAGGAAVANEAQVWVCKCGTENSTNYGMCKKCGSHRSSQ